jgi:hypothetical protein
VSHVVRLHFIIIVMNASCLSAFAAHAVCVTTPQESGAQDRPHSATGEGAEEEFEVQQADSGNGAKADSTAVVYKKDQALHFLKLVLYLVQVRLM